MSGYPDWMGGSDWCHVEGCTFDDGNVCTNCGVRIYPRCIECGQFVKITQLVCDHCLKADALKETGVEAK